MSGVFRRNRLNRRDEELEQRDEELERLRRLVRDLELQVRGRRQRRDHEEQGERSASGGVIMEQGPINSNLIGTRIASRNMQTGI